MGDLHLVMWWVPEGQRPTLDEGLERLAHLQAQGDFRVVIENVREAIDLVREADGEGHRART